MQSSELTVICLSSDDVINSSSVSLSKLSLTLFIWYSLENQEETVFEIWLSLVKWSSKKTAKSLAKATGFNVEPRNGMLRFCGSLFNICLVPGKRSLVLSGFMSNWFSQHHWATLRRSCFSFSIAASSSISGKDS